VTDQREFKQIQFQDHTGIQSSRLPEIVGVQTATSNRESWLGTGYDGNLRIPENLLESWNQSK